ncbi:MAG: hypothetical protein HDR88_18870 [Bacteroides sp.]|nr:hypothetical protein [Bacteroides sp.]MBD5359024.1 hypothetical protein [Bacteroides sp.]
MKISCQVGPASPVTAGEYLIHFTSPRLPFPEADFHYSLMVGGVSRAERNLLINP